MKCPDLFGFLQAKLKAKGTQAGSSQVWLDSQIKVFIVRRLHHLQSPKKHAHGALRHLQRGATLSVWGIAPAAMG